MQLSASSVYATTDKLSIERTDKTLLNKLPVNYSITFVLNFSNYVIPSWFRGKRTDHGELDFSSFSFLSDECCDLHDRNSFCVFSISVIMVIVPSFFTCFMRPYGNLTCSTATESRVLPRPATTGV
jgi:hypothetical protein